MAPTVKIALMLLAGIGFAGVGGSLAVARLHQLQQGDADYGMRAIAVVLACFSAMCIVPVAGYLGVPAFGGVISWFSYVCSAQRIGVFRIELFTSEPSAHARR